MIWPLGIAVCFVLIEPPQCDALLFNWLSIVCLAYTYAPVILIFTRSHWPYVNPRHSRAQVKPVRTFEHAWALCRNVHIKMISRITLKLTTFLCTIVMISDARSLLAKTYRKRTRSFVVVDRFTQENSSPKDAWEVNQGKSEIFS